MIIASLNVNSLRRNFDEIQNILSNLGIHVLALNETKLDDNHLKELTGILGYQQVRFDRTRNGGGVSIYIRESIKSRTRSDVPKNDIELICIEIEPPKSKPFLVLAWYKPLSVPVDVFIELEKVICYFDREGKELILLGDTNCDLTTVQQNDVHAMDGNAKYICRIYELLNFKQLIEEPTRVTLNTATIIDHIATTHCRNIVDSWVYQMALSDHYLVYCIRKFNGAVTKDHKVIKTRKMNIFDEGQFLTDVASVCWERVVTQTDDVDIIVKNWSALFSWIIDKHAPILQMCVSEKYCPWINHDLKVLMRNRDRMKMVALKRKSSTMMDSYRQLRNRVNTLNIQLKKQYFSNKISACKGNVKDSWKAINELLNKRSKSCNIDFLKDSDKEVRQRSDISNLMNG